MTQEKNKDIDLLFKDMSSKFVLLFSYLFKVGKRKGCESTPAFHHNPRAMKVTYPEDYVDFNIYAENLRQQLKLTYEQTRGNKSATARLQKSYRHNPRVRRA